MTYDTEMIVEKNSCFHHSHFPSHYEEGPSLFFAEKWKEELSVTSEASGPLLTPRECFQRKWERAGSDRVLRRQTALWSRPFDFSIGVFHQPPQIEFIYEQMTWTGSLSFDISLADRYGKWPLRVLHPVRWWSCLNNLFYEGVRVFSSIVSRTFRKDRHGGIGGEGILAEIKSCPEWLQNQSWNPFLRHASR